VEAVVEVEVWPLFGHRMEMRWQGGGPCVLWEISLVETKRRKKGERLVYIQSAGTRNSR
jgi:hypothetical protein